jgi:ADP-ribose diphosphatase
VATVKKSPEIIAYKTMLTSRMFNVETRDVVFANGNINNYEVVSPQYNGAVLVVPILDRSSILLIREYSAGVNRYELGFPKGKVEQGEDILSAANRELQEEVGFAAGTLRHVKTVTLAPGMFSHESYIVFAENLTPSKLEGDEPEEIETVHVDLSRIEDMLAHKDLTEARSLLAFYMVRDYLRTNASTI